MVYSMLLAAFFFSILLSWVLTSYVRLYALKKNLLDIPNIRSSHTVATARGGGIAIVTVLMLSGLSSLLLSETGFSSLLSLLLATLAFSILGWQDDKYDLSAFPKFLIQFLIAGLVSIWLFWDLIGWPWSFYRVIIFLLSVLWIAWMANVYNFMDGIDGISAVESIILGVATASWFMMHGSISIAILCMTVAGAALGFLRWNWSPAKIFMGDVGSLALGGFFALIAIIGATAAEIPFSAFLVLYAVYLADTGVTLMNRMIKKEKWWQAHHSHFYQRAVQSGFSHAQVSLAVMGLDILLAILASLLVVDMISVSTAVAVTMLMLTACMFLINSLFKRFNSK